MSLRGIQTHLVETYEEAGAFMRWLGERREGPLAFDLETGGLEWWKQPVRLAQFGDGMTGWAIPWGRWSGLVHETFEKYEGDYVAHNAKFDVLFLEKNGVTVPRHRVHDTRTLAHLIDPSKSTGLKGLATRYIDPRSSAGESTLRKAMQKQKWGWDSVPVEFPGYWAYGALDTILTSRLYELLAPKVEKTAPDLYDIEMACLWALANMEKKGARIDREYTEMTQQRLLLKCEEIRTWCGERYGMNNPNSNRELAAKLKAEGVHLTERTPKGDLKVDAEVLEKVNHPLANAVLEYREKRKIARTYLGNLLEMADSNDIVHCSINPLGARTGRMSISSPPLQQIPRGPLVRDSFVARDGNTLALIDYDQVELRVFAHYADEQGMIDAIHNGIDLHSFVCRQVYGIPDDEEVPKEKRQVTKNANFSKIYGAGVEKFAWTAGISVEDAEEFMSRYEVMFPGVRAFQNKVDRMAMDRLRNEGEAYITTWLGRKQPVEGRETYKLTNYLIQGSCADLLKQKIVELDCAGFGDYMILPVHDELIFDIPDEDIEDGVVEEISAIMQELHAFKVPLSAGPETAKRWGDKYRDAA